MFVKLQEKTASCGDVQTDFNGPAREVKSAGVKEEGVLVEICQRCIDIRFFETTGWFLYGALWFPFADVV